MYLIDDLVITSGTVSPSSKEGILSEYFLMHMKDAAHLKLNDVSKETALSGSSVSRFCNALGSENFTEFQTLLAEDAQNLHSYHTYLLEQGIPSSNAKWIDPLVKRLRESRSVLLYGDVEGQMMFFDGVREMLLSGKKASMCTGYDMEAKREKLMMLEERDTLILFAESYDQNTYLEHSYTAFNVPDEIRTLKAEVYMFSRSSSSALKNWHCIADSSRDDLRALNMKIVKEFLA